ncbi:MAG: pyruvate/2-oxoacid:ferredoxin oxidoreductase alpha subunit [Halieaceae bacterium]|jgi:pyruvate/2-oxoacid:ferredoxin oxidoreductase alpha subunit
MTVSEFSLAVTGAGAAYGAVRAFTATSGPGLALMTESIGLAVASETPITILNVMRGGPLRAFPRDPNRAISILPCMAYTATRRIW